jgi:hypothetical protein
LALARERRRKRAGLPRAIRTCRNTDGRKSARYPFSPGHFSLNDPHFNATVRAFLAIEINEIEAWRPRWFETCPLGVDAQR